MRILILFSFLLVFSCKIKKVENSSTKSDNSLETQILKETLNEVLLIDSARLKQMSVDDKLILKISSSFGVQKIDRYEGQNIMLITESELEKLTMASGGKRKYLYIQLDKRDENTFESTASYNCGEMDEDDPGKVLSDHFCLGGMVIDFKKEGLKLSKHISYKI